MFNIFAFFDNIHIFKQTLQTVSSKIKTNFSPLLCNKRFLSQFASFINNIIIKIIITVSTFNCLNSYSTNCKYYLKLSPTRLTL